MLHRGSARKPGRVLLAGAFHQHLHLPADKARVAPPRNLVDQPQQPLVPFLAEAPAAPGSGIAAAGVSRRSEYLKMKAWSNSTSRASESVCWKSSSLSPGKPTMKSVESPMAGWTRAQFLDQAQVTLARVAAVHQLEDAVAPALDGDVGALGQLGQTPVRRHQVVAVPLGMR